MANSRALSTLIIGSVALLASSFVASCVVQPPPQQQGQMVVAPTPASHPNYHPIANRPVQMNNANWGQAVHTPVQTTTPPQTPVQAQQISTAGMAAPVSFRDIQQHGIRVAYGPTQNFAQIRKAFQDAQIFEQIAQTMNQILVMPKVLNIQMAECGTVNAFYDPQNQRIIMCYEMVAHTFQTFGRSMQDQEQVAKAGVHASLFIFFHEFGHALRDILNLPVTGREEDAVDQFSTMLLIDAGSHEGVLMGAQFFALESARYNNAQAQKLPFWDEHSLEQQRFYNILCLLYGSNPQAYQQLVANQTLPKPRAQRCPAEYKNIDGAWTRLLDPHLTPAAKQAQQSGTPMQVATPNAAPAPMPAPNPAPAPAPQQQVSCEHVGQKVVQLIFAQYQAQFAQMTPAQQQTIQQQVMQMYQQLVTQCQNENWSQQSRMCVMQSASMEQAQTCN